MKKKKTSTNSCQFDESNKEFFAWFNTIMKSIELAVNVYGLYALCVENVQFHYRNGNR